MPGTYLDLVLPSGSDTMATVVAKTATALSAIQDDLTPSITSGEININAALSFNGMPATGLGSVGLIAGNTPTAAGSIYYSGGEFFAIDGTGVVQLTLSGKVNVLAAAGFTGDYGTSGVTAQARYTNSSNLFQFFNGVGSSALECGALIVDNTAGGEQLRVDYTGTTAGTKALHISTLPGSGSTLLSFIGATGVLAPVPTVVGASSTGAVDTFAMSTSSYIRRTNLVYVMPLLSGSTYVAAGTTPISSANPGVGCSAAGTYYIPIYGWPTEAAIQNVVVHSAAAAAPVGTVTISLVYADGINGFANAIAGATSVSWGAGNVTVTLTPTTPATIAHGVWLKIVTAASSTVTALEATVTLAIP